MALATAAGGTFSAGTDLKRFERGEFPVLRGRGFGGLARVRAKSLLEQTNVPALTAPRRAVGAASRLACRVGQKAPLALVVVTDVLRETTALNDDDACRRQDEYVTRSEDARGGATAFAAKRAPKWRGR